MEKDITVILGPTAIGKSKYAIELAKKTGGEIISADAFQVYRDMNIGTAKVPDSISTKIPHHLINILWPNEPYSVASFQKKATSLINVLKTQKKPIILCGGTALYIKSFLHQYEFKPHTRKLKKYLQFFEKELQIKGALNLWHMLKEIDPEMAKKTPSENTRRVIKYLAGYYETKQKPSAAPHQTSPPRSDCHIIGLYHDRTHLYTLINNRVDSMIKNGLIEEVEGLLEKFPANSPGFQAIGYKEVIDYLEGRFEKEEMIDYLKQKTRNFAKRQLTWYRKLEYVHWIKAA